MNNETNSSASKEHLLAEEIAQSLYGFTANEYRSVGKGCNHEEYILAKDIGEISQKLASQFTQPDHQELEVYKEWHDDNKRLVRELDEIINGKQGMAQQASLCDLVAQMRTIRPELEARNAALSTALNKAVELIKLWHDMPNASGNVPIELRERAWEIYYSMAPEMKLIREGQQSGK